MAPASACMRAPAQRTRVVLAASSGSFSGKPLVPSGPRKGTVDAGKGVFLLLLLNIILFIADHFVLLSPIKQLYLNHAHPQWFQFVMHTFCHANLAHLQNNLFLLLVFGKMVEETEGSFGVWFVYLITGVGAALATFLLTPAVHNGHATVSVGASGAIFGLFAVSVLTRITGSLRKLLEAAILGQFVLRQVLEEVKHQVSGGLVMAGGLQVSHLAHLGGALAGVLLVLALHRLPQGDDAGDKK